MAERNLDSNDSAYVTSVLELLIYDSSVTIADSDIISSSEIVQALSDINAPFIGIGTGKRTFWR
jgi:hypothetical protein